MIIARGRAALCAATSPHRAAMAAGTCARARRVCSSAHMTHRRTHATTTTLPAPQRQGRRPLLISFDHRRPKDPPMSLAVASIVANLQAHRMEYGVVTTNVNAAAAATPGEAASDTSLTVAGVVGGVLDTALGAEWARPDTDLWVGAFVWCEPHVQRLLADLRRHGFPGRVCVAGPQVSYAAPGTLEQYYPHAHLFVRGYAEHAVAALARQSPTQCASEPAAAFRGVHYHGCTDTGVQCEAQLLHLASPYLTRVLDAGAGFARWETQRGCPYACSFCQHRAPNNAGVQAMRVDRVTAEIDLFAAATATRSTGTATTGTQVRYPGIDAAARKPLPGDHARPQSDTRLHSTVAAAVALASLQGGPAAPAPHPLAPPPPPPQTIAVVDPTFNSPATRAVPILHRFAASGYQGRLSLQIRPEKLSDAFLDAVRVFTDGGGRVTLEVGIQSVAPAELAAIDRIAGADPRAMVRAIERKLRKVADSGCGADLEVSVMFGLPHQTVASFAHTLQWCATHAPGAKVSAFPLMLLRGTALHARRRELGLVESTEVAHPCIDRVQAWVPHVVETPTMTRAEWRDMADMAAGLVS